MNVWHFCVSASAMLKTFAEIHLVVLSVAAYQWSYLRGVLWNVWRAQAMTNFFSQPVGERVIPRAMPKRENDQNHMLAFRKSHMHQSLMPTRCQACVCVYVCAFTVAYVLENISQYRPFFKNHDNIFIKTKHSPIIIIRACRKFQNKNFSLP